MLIQRCLWSPAEACQIRIFSFRDGSPRGFLCFTQHTLGFFFSPIHLQRFFAIAFRERRFSCSSDGVLLSLA